MRLYLIVNRYSMGIQAGIQAMHVIPELYEKFKSEKWDPRFRINLSEWAQNHKTIMVLRNFGGNDDIENLYSTIAPIAKEEKLPFAIFREPALRNSATAVGIIVPTEYYRNFEITESLENLHLLLDKFPFAN